MDPDAELRLIARCHEGDAKAFRRLFKHYRGFAYRVAYAFTGCAEAAEDAQQKSWLKVVDGVGAFNGGSRFRTWFTRIVINAAIDLQRQTHRSNPVEHAQAAELEAALQEGIQQLSAHQRAALVLVALEGLSYAEAAAALECPEGTLAWHVAEARRKLAARLAPYLDGGA